MNWGSASRSGSISLVPALDDNFHSRRGDLFVYGHEDHCIDAVVSSLVGQQLPQDGRVLVVDA